MNTRIQRWIACVRFEAAKLVRRRLPWITLAITMLTAVGTGWIAASGDAETALTGYALYARILEVTVPVTGFFLVIMGCLTITEEAASGSLRAVLLRPVSRGDVVVTKIVVHVAFSAVTLACVLTAAWLLVSSRGGFGAVMIEIPGLEPIVKFDEATIRGFAWKLSFSTLPAVLCAPVFGLLVSLFTESEGTAVAVGVFLFGAMETLGGAFEGVRDWVFPSYFHIPIERLAEVAKGIETNRHEIESLGPASSQVLFPLGMLLVFALAAVLVFRQKEITC